MKSNYLKKLFLLTAILLFSSATSFSHYPMGNYIRKELSLPEGGVRAIVVKDKSELLGGPKAEGMIGDFKIYNDRVGFIISNVRPASGYGLYGGHVEDAGLLRNQNDGYYWWNLMGDVYPIFYQGFSAILQSRLFEPVSAEIVKDGTDGVAIVRVRGKDAEFPLVKEFMRLRKSRSLKADITIDYILRPASRALEVVTTLKNPGDKKRAINMGMVFMMGDGEDIFAPDVGFDSEGMRGRSFNMIGSAGQGISYGWYSQEDKIYIYEKVFSLVAASYGHLTAPPQGEGSFRYYFIVGSGDEASVLEEKYRLVGETALGTLSGRCEEQGTGKPAPDAEVHVLTPEGEHRNQITVGADGTFRAVMPPGEYLLQPVSYDRDDSPPTRVVIKNGEETSVTINVPKSATMEYEITNEWGERIPATISFKLLNAKPTAADDTKFTVKNFGGGFYKTVFSDSGVGSVALRPGRYEVYFSRGFEYEIDKKELSIAGGETVRQKAVLAHTVDTTGFLSGDFHVHSQPSPDSDDDINDKVMGAAACGLEVPIPTDHDRNTDYKPYIKKLGMEKYVNSIVGEELTTLQLGHFNAYPLTYDPDKPNGGAIRWYGLTGPQIFKAFRDDPGEYEVIQINHPRSVGGGYFDFVGYDPKTGIAADKVNFSWNFDAMEVLNGDGYRDMKYTVPDWFSFLNRGRHITGVGNSDSHRVFQLQLGYPRNYVMSPTDEPEKMEETDFIKAILAQKVVVSGGPFIRFRINENGELGSLVKDTDGVVTLNIEVQAPSWMEVKTLTIIGNGETIKTIPITGCRGAVCYKGAVRVNPKRDTWYIVRVDGDKDLFPVYPGTKPLSFTNPIWVDVDGNGKFDPLL